jgi:hypothetical protein
MKLRAAMPARARILGSLILLALVAIACQPREIVIVPSSGGESTDATSRELKLVTLLPYDSIPAIFDPRFVSAAEASGTGRQSAMYRSDEKILGIEINGDVRAYSVPMLRRHEIVNDIVRGIPIAVTL